MALNKFQLAVLKTYAEGDYAFIATDEYASRWRECVAVANSGDSLFQFVMIDLADEGSFKMTRDEAIRRIDQAREHLEKVRFEVFREGTLG
jgi:hypothetical protein